MSNPKSTFVSIGEVMQKIVDGMIIKPDNDEEQAFADLSAERLEKDFRNRREETNEDVCPYDDD